MGSSYARICALIKWLCQGYNRHSFGRFVGFQRVTREKNQQDPFPNFFVPSASPAARTAGPARRRVATWRDGSMGCVFPKAKSPLLITRPRRVARRSQTGKTVKTVVSL